MAQKSLKTPYSQGPSSIKSPTARTPASDEADQAIAESMAESIASPDISLSEADIADEQAAAEQAQQEESQAEAEVSAAIAPEQQQIAERARQEKLQAMLGLSKGASGAVAGIGAGAGAARLASVTRLGNVVSPGTVGTVAGITAGVLAQVNADKIFRDMFGIDQPKNESEQDKIIKNAILDEVAGAGIGAIIPQMLRYGVKAVSGIANGAEINRVRALTTLESVLNKFESAFGSKITQEEAERRFSGLLASEREQSGKAIGNIKNAAALIENQSGQKSSVSNAMTALQEVLQKEGVIFKDNEILGLTEGAGTAPFSLPAARGKRILNDLINEYNAMYSSVKQRKGLPVSEIDKLGTSFEVKASEQATLPGKSTYVQKVYNDISRALNQDRDFAYDRLLKGTVYENTWKEKIWAPNEERLGLLKEAQNAFANENISQMVIENRPDLVRKMVSVFGSDSDVVSSMKDVFVKSLLEKDPGLGVVNPIKVIQKINSSGKMLNELFSPEDVISMKRFALQAKRLNSSRFGSSAASDRFADDAVDVVSKMTSPRQAAAALYEIGSSNMEVFKKINSAILNRAKSLPPRDADKWNDMAQSLVDYMSLSNQVTTQTGVVKMIPGPLLKRVLLREFPKYKFNTRNVPVEDAKASAESANQLSNQDITLSEEDL